MTFFKARGPFIYLLLSMFLLCSSMGKQSFAATKTATAGTDWATATWVGGDNLQPTSTDDAIITSGINLNISTAAVCGSLTIGTNNATATTLTLVSGGSLVVSGTTGDLVINPSNRAANFILAVATQTLTVAGTLSFSRSTDQITLSTGNLVFSATTGLTMSAGLISMSASGNVIFDGLVTHSSGTIQNITTGGKFFFNGGYNKSGGTFTTLAAGTTNIGGDLTVSTNPLTISSSVVFTGNSTITPTAAITFNRAVTINASVIVTLAGSVTLGNNLTINGTYDLQTYTSNRLALGGFFIMGSAGVLKLGGSSGGQSGSNFPTNFNTVSFQNSSFVEYNAGNGVNQSIYAGLSNYGNLILSNSSGTGSSTKTPLGNIKCYNLSINSNAIFSGSSYTIEVRRDWTNAGTFSGGTSTIIFDRNAVGGTSTISNAAGETFNHLSLASTGGITTVLLACNVSIAGDFNISAGIMDLSTFTANRATAGGTLTIGAGASLKLAAGSGGQSGSNFPANFTTLTIDATSTVEYNSANGIDQTVFAVGTGGYGNLTLSNTTGSGNSNKIATSALIIYGALTISDAFTTFKSGSSTHSLAGDWINNGSFQHENGEIDFISTTEISGTSVTIFNNLLINTGATLTGTSGNMNVAGNFVNNGISFIHNAGTVTFSGSTTLSGSTEFSFNDVIISGTLTAVASGNFNVEGDFTNNETFIHNSGNVVFTGSANQSMLGSASTNFYDITISTAGTTYNETTVNLIRGLSLTGTSVFDADGAGDNKIFTLKSSSSSSTAYITNIPTGASVSGNITVERFIPGTSPGWGILGPPVAGQNVGNWADNGEIITSCPSGCNVSMSFNSVYYYDETIPTTSTLLSEGYTPCTNATSLVNGAGYFLWIADNLTTAADRTVSVTGLANTDDQPISLTYTDGDPYSDGWNLISNPYPSPISWTSLEADAGTPGNIDNTIYVYNADLNGGNGDWAIYTIGGSSVPAVGSGGVDDNIPMGQGFFVKLSGTTTLTAKESHKSTVNNAFLKNDPTLASSASILRLFLSNEIYHTETAIIFDNRATPHFDKEYDAYRLENLNSKTPAISTILEDTAYQLNCLPLKNNSSIPLKVIVGKTGAYTLNTSDINLVPSLYTSVILEDKLTGIKTDLRKTNSYTFSISDTTQTPRFVLHFLSSPLNVDEKHDVKENIFVTIAGDRLNCKFQFDKPEKIIIRYYNLLGQEISEPSEYEVYDETLNISLPPFSLEWILVNIVSSQGQYTRPVFKR